MAYHTKQVKVRKSSILKNMASKAFMLGMDDIRQGLPLREMPDRDDQWRYERGRLFACIFHGPLKEGRRVTDEALAAYKLARAQHAII